ncbi:hypothetical protein [Mangrovimonas spongiae]|uniref:DUF1129 family protein n=1 Tax=Mangrovimonas spongiae TaxID=2494697 RepID=A0A3R9NTP2_9FLAO|nr:hypothetical protein [Mangrovimonas spongiae]RSK41489.1 hypothetical protein EJA19_01040 [Mangrovimonas spongiae]
MTITEQHIEQLYKFTRQHYVEYYDLQTELVDHMANDIEAIWDENPHISFEEARDKAFKKFGVFGFMDVVEAREKAMHKKYFKLLLSYAKDWFRLPQVLLTISLLLGFYTLFRTELGGIILGVSFIVFFVFYLVVGVHFALKRKRDKKENKKVWLFEQIIFSNVIWWGTIYAPQLINISKAFDTLSYSMIWSALYAILITLAIIYIYITAIIIPKNAQIHLKETYPEYNM